VAAPLITAISDDTGSSPTDGITADSTLVFRGTATAGHTVTVKILGGAALGVATSDGSGQWSLDYTGNVLSDGAYVVSASASNGAGTSLSSRAFPVRIDTAAPAVVTVNRQNPTAAISSADTITFRVTFSEPVAGAAAADFTPVFTGALSGAISGVVQAGEGVFDVTVGLSGEGAVRLDVNASGIADIAGNALNAGFTAGQVYTRSLVGDGTWIQSANGAMWNTNQNWLNGIVGAGVGATANFSSLELVDDLIVHLDAPRTIGNLVFGDTDIASPGSWTVDNNGGLGNVLLLAVPAGSPTVTVNPLGLGATTLISAPAH
jgi:hypothetical protein